MKEGSVILDSSVWIEILAKGPRSKSCHRELKKAKRVVVPTLVIFEVYRKIAKNISEDQGLLAVAAMSQYEVVDMTKEIALTAADLSLQYRLSMADSIILAHSTQFAALLITLDNDFIKIPGVKIIRR